MEVQVLEAFIAAAVALLVFGILLAAVFAVLGVLPLIALAVPSVYAGWAYIEPMLFGNFFHGSIYVNPAVHPTMHELAHHFHGAAEMALHAVTSLPFLFAARSPGATADTARAAAVAAYALPLTGGAASPAASG